MIPAAMVDYGLYRLQHPLRLQQSLIMVVLGHSGQRTSVKLAEAAWNYKVKSVVHLKLPAFFFFIYLPYA